MGNGDGVLTVAELAAGLRQAEIRRTDTEIAGLVQSVDGNSNGAVEYTEFIAAALGPEVHLDVATCWRAFNIFDRDTDGSISQPELDAIFGGGKMTKSAKGFACKALQDADLNGDGQISFHEFMQMI